MATEHEYYWVYGGGPTSVQLLPRTSGTYGERQLVLPISLGNVQGEMWTSSTPWGYGRTEQGYAFDKPRTIQLRLKIIAGTERKAMSELEDFQAHFRPNILGKLRWKYYEQDGPTQRDLYLEARRSTLEGFSWPGPITLVSNPAGGFAVFSVELEAQYPFWRDYTATATDTVSLSTTPQVVAVTNPGDIPIGVKFALSGVSSPWSTVTIANATTGSMRGVGSITGGTLVWSDTTSLTTGDYVDYRHTYPNQVSVSSGSLSDTSVLLLWPGSNSLTVTCAGGSGGTGTFTKRGAYIR